MRNEFEKLPKITEILLDYKDEVVFNELDNKYITPCYSTLIPEYLYELNMGWYVYQELHNSLGFVKGGYIGSTEYNIDSVFGRGCFEHFKNAIATDGTQIGSTEKLQVSYPYVIKMVNKK